MDLVFRTGAPADYDSYRRIVEENKLIDPVEMDAMLVDKANAADGNWFTCALAVCPTDDQSIVGVAYCSYEKIALQTINMVLLAVSPAHQGQKIGSEFVSFIEAWYKQRQGRLLLVETSSLLEFQRTRRFYEKIGYILQGSIKDFWADGEDKVIYTKKLSPSKPVLT